MKTYYNDFKLMLLRPFVYNGAEAELNIEFENAKLYPADAGEAIAIGMQPGDAVTIRGRVIFSEENGESENITIYMGEKALDDFINKYGVSKISVSARIRVELKYVLLHKHCFSENTTENLTAFKLIQLIPKD